MSSIFAMEAPLIIGDIPRRGVSPFLLIKRYDIKNNLKYQLKKIKLKNLLTIKIDNK